MRLAYSVPALAVKQGYGFSNNPSSTFGPPSFSSAAFEYRGGGLNLPVQLSY
jgi:uncharacterized protein (DUF2141 family)